MFCTRCQYNCKSSHASYQVQARLMAQQHLKRKHGLHLPQAQTHTRDTHVYRRCIQVVASLIQQQHIAGHECKGGKRHARLFATTKHTCRTASGRRHSSSKLTACQKGRCKYPAAKMPLSRSQWPCPQCCTGLPPETAQPRSAPTPQAPAPPSVRTNLLQRHAVLQTQSTQRLAALLHGDTRVLLARHLLNILQRRLVEGKLLEGAWDAQG